MKRKRIVDDTWRSPDKILRERGVRMILKDCLYDKARRLLFRWFPKLFDK